MFDFRYHALSLVAVFLALAVGLLLGVAIGDRGLVSGAEDNLRADLRGDVEQARDESRAGRQELAQRARYEEDTYPTVVGGRLEGRRIAMVFLHGRSETVATAVTRALAPSGAELASASTLRLPPDRKALASRLAGTRYETLDDDADVLDAFAERMGQQFIQGGQLLQLVRGELLSSSSGSLSGAEGVVIARSDPGERGKEEATLDERYERAFIRGLQSYNTPVVGVELTSTDPSQIGWYRQSDLASIDNVDWTSGRASLVFALAGAADGAYGTKSTADALFPVAALPRRPGEP